MDDIIISIYFITMYPCLAVYSDIKCKALTELTAFALYFFIEIYADFIVGTNVYDADDTVLF